MSQESLPSPFREDPLATSQGDPPLASNEVSSSRVKTHRWRDKIDPWLDRGSEWMNPILVKESRQAFKSRQFMTTFSLLLICCWLWSLFAVAIRSPGIYYAPAGRFLLIGYYLILVFPLVIIIPFSAFRSLASERDDGTYELLSISTLRPRQIISGKMSSSMLQMLIYLSVLTPCMTFTYLLRGVDIAIILIVIFYSVLTCWFLSGLGLMLATLTGPRHWQVFASVFFILFLAVSWVTISWTGSLGLSEAPAADVKSWEFWTVQGMIISALVAGGSMFLLAATAKITPRSENRSTGLRIGMLVCQLIFFLWCMFFMAVWTDEDGIIFYTIFASIGWVLFGSLMVGEDWLLSPRIRRSLPKTALGRVFLTLFFPGPGTGYLFAVSNMLMSFVGCVALALHCLNDNDTMDYVAAAWVAFCYVTIFLGLTRIIVRWISRTSSTGPVLGLLICTVLVGLSSIFCLIVQFAMWNDDYSLLQLPNAIWTFVEVADGAGPESFFILLILTIVAALIFLINLLRMSSQLQIEKTIVPSRVAEDEQQLHPTPEPVHVRTSPWDEE